MATRSLEFNPSSTGAGVVGGPAEVARECQEDSFGRQGEVELAVHGVEKEGGGRVEVLGPQRRGDVGSFTNSNLVAQLLDALGTEAAAADGGEEAPSHAVCGLQLRVVLLRVGVAAAVHIDGEVGGVPQDRLHLAALGASLVDQVRGLPTDL
jgi:hypothetical protein